MFVLPPISVQVEAVRDVLQRIDVNHIATLRLLTEVLSKVSSAPSPLVPMQY